MFPNRTRWTINWNYRRKTTWMPSFESRKGFEKIYFVEEDSKTWVVYYIGKEVSNWDRYLPKHAMTIFIKVGICYR